MKIRYARDEDYAALARLHRQTIRNVNAKDYSEEIIETWSARPNAKRFRDSADKCKRWVATQDNKIVGFCDHSLSGELWGLYIHKDYMGQKIGSRLLKTAEDSLKKLGFKKNTFKATITAKPFYLKHGYKVIKEDIHQIDDKKLLVFIMSKKLV